jgi:hypothetical protein
VIEVLFFVTGLVLGITCPWKAWLAKTWDRLNRKAPE